MTFPNYPDKHKAASLLDPAEMIAYRRRLGRLPRMQPPEAVLICLQRGLPEHMRWRVPVRHVGRLMGDLFLVRRARAQVAVLSNFGIGAPAVVALAEELIAFGAKRLISMVWGGGLQARLKPGSIVVVERAIRDEGTSHHYLPASKYAQASPELVAKLAQTLRARGYECQVGTSWTTDAPYRETREEVQRYQSEGADTVEMESAALLALGQVRNVQTAAVVVVGDSLAGLRWQAPSDVGPIERALEQVYAGSIEALDQA